VFYNHYTILQMARDMSTERQREARNYRIWQKARRAVSKRAK
jgi:hypothetical protein